MANVGLFFRRLYELGPAYVSFPEESKSMLIVRGKNTEKAENFRKENESCFLIKMVLGISAVL